MVWGRCLCTNVQHVHKCANRSSITRSQGVGRVNEITLPIIGHHLFMEHPSTWLTLSLAELASPITLEYRVSWVCLSPTVGKVSKESCSPYNWGPSLETGTEQLLRRACCSLAIPTSRTFRVSPTFRLCFCWSSPAGCSATLDL